MTASRLHGGGYVLGSAYGYRPLVGALADAAQAGALVVDYRLAPEHPFPAGCRRRCHGVPVAGRAARRPGQGRPGGDSAGAGLVIALRGRLVEADEPMPAGAVLLCPAIDMTGQLLLSVREPDVMDEIWQAGRFVRRSLAKAARPSTETG